MEYIMILVIIAAIGYVALLHMKINKEIKRSRSHQAFTAGIIRAITDYTSLTDKQNPEMPIRVSTLPIPYAVLLDHVEYELAKDLLLARYEKWLRTERNIFFDSKYAEDGFNFMYLDLFDRMLSKSKSDNA